MKKLLLGLLALSLIISASACGNDSQDGSSAPVVSQSSVAEDECAEALSLISQAKYEEAYKLLLSVKDSQKAQELLDNFSIKPSNLKITKANGAIEAVELIYNSFGMQMKKTVNGTVEILNTYDLNGSILNSQQVINGETINSEYTYENGKLVKTTEKKGDELYCTITYTYSGENVSAETHTLANGDVTKTEYTYDADGREISETTTLPNGKTESIKYEYASNGAVSKETFVNADGSEMTVAYTYNGNGDVEIEVYTTAETVETRKYTYFGSDLAKMVCTVAKGEEETETQVAEYSYDANGNLVKEVSTTDKGVLTVEYTYNSAGNLEKRVRTMVTSDNETETSVYEYSNYRYYYAE